MPVAAPVLRFAHRGTIPATAGMLVVVSMKEGGLSRALASTIVCVERA
jgi:hypothetical protein